MFKIEINTILFLAVFVLVAVVLTITGFPMGLVTMAGISVAGVADIAFTRQWLALFRWLTLVLVCVKHTIRLVGTTLSGSASLFSSDGGSFCATHLPE